MLLLPWIKRPFWNESFFSQQMQWRIQAPMPPPPSQPNFSISWIFWENNQNESLLPPIRGIHDPPRDLSFFSFVKVVKVYFIYHSCSFHVHLHGTSVMVSSRWNSLRLNCAEYYPSFTCEKVSSKGVHTICTRFQMHVPRIRLTIVVHQKATWKYIISISFLWTLSRQIALKHLRCAFVHEYLSLRI